jgi:prepilin-type N-terminal cleavage/methylation domain-containing protein
MRKNKQGFTIIEVVLVLAIGGLIFLMVFIALPSLNASQRDTQRRQDSAIIAAAVRDFMKHNHNNVPPASTYKIESTDNGDNTTTNSFGG